MRAIYPVFLLFLFAASASAQALTTLSETSDILVVQKKWSVEVHNPMLEDPTIRDDFEQNKEIEKQNAIRIRRGLPTESTVVPDLENLTAIRNSLTTYTYQVKIKNNTDKEIQTIIWDYVFSEPGTNKQIGCLRFLNKVNLSPGKTKDLVKQSAYPPTGIIDAKQAGKKLRDQYTEQIVIQSIEYADGSVWKAGNAPIK